MARRHERVIPCLHRYVRDLGDCEGAVNRREKVYETKQTETCGTYMILNHLIIRPTDLVQ